MRLRAGDWVEVRSREELLATLDGDGCLDGIPFMPEMLQYSGRRLQVMSRAHKTCDTVNRTGGRRVRSAVHLDELRCDGAAHGGCDAACLLFWHEAWLKRDGSQADQRSAQGPCDEAALHKATRDGNAPGEDPVYRCQATRLPEFTTPLKWWDLRQYLEDWTSGNVRLRTLAGGAIYVMYFGLVRRTERISWSAAQVLIRMYNLVQRIRGGTPYPRLRGQVPQGTPTPSRELGLEKGECVRVLPYPKILETLDGRNKNRGMYFDAEEVPYCNGTFRVRSRVLQIIDERSGRMIQLKGRNVSLEGAWCKGHYSDRRMHCPRAILPIWRETWLERAADQTEREAE
jgi:hypothetical protein